MLIRAAAQAIASLLALASLPPAHAATQSSPAIAAYIIDARLPPAARAALERRATEPGAFPRRFVLLCSWQAGSCSKDPISVPHQVRPAIDDIVDKGGQSIPPNLSEIGARADLVYRAFNKYWSNLSDRVTPDGADDELSITFVVAGPIGLRGGRDENLNDYVPVDSCFAQMEQLGKDLYLVAGAVPPRAKITFRVLATQESERLPDEAAHALALALGDQPATPVIYMGQSNLECAQPEQRPVPLNPLGGNACRRPSRISIPPPPLVCRGPISQRPITPTPPSPPALPSILAPPPSSPGPVGPQTFNNQRPLPPPPPAQSPPPPPSAPISRPPSHPVQQEREGRRLIPARTEPGVAFRWVDASRPPGLVATLVLTAIPGGPSTPPIAESARGAPLSVGVPRPLGKGVYRVLATVPPPSGTTDDCPRRVLEGTLQARGRDIAEARQVQVETVLHDCADDGPTQIILDEFSVP